MLKEVNSCHFGLAKMVGQDVVKLMIDLETLVLELNVEKLFVTSKKNEAELDFNSASVYVPSSILC